MTSFSKTILRPLTTEDVPAIGAICQDVYNGFDHVPYFIDSWIADDDVLTLGIEQNGVLVALQATHIVDDGQTAVLGGLRVHPDHRGRGVASLMKAAVMELVRRKAPTVKRIRASFGSYNQASARLKADWKQICSSGFFIIELIEEILQSQRVSTLLLPELRLKPLPFEELCTALIENCPPFLPNTLLWDVQPVTLSKSNLKKTFDNGCLWLLRRSDEGAVTSVSFGSFFSRPNYHLWTCSLYGFSEEEVHFQAIEQLKYAYQYSESKAFFFQCCLPEKFAESAGSTIQKMGVLKLGPFSIIAKETLLH